MSHRGSMRMEGKKEMRKDDGDLRLDLPELVETNYVLVVTYVAQLLKE